VPFYEGLTIDQFLKEAFKHEKVKDYLPEGPDLARVNRQWVCNVVYTIVGQPIADYVAYKVNDRNVKIAEKQQLELELDPEVANAYQRSNQVSSKSKRYYKINL
jgi:hypothetical protein